MILWFFTIFSPQRKKWQFINRKFFIVLKSLENIDHSEVSPLQFKSIHKNKKFYNVNNTKVIFI